MNSFSMSLEILLIINVVIIVLGYIGYMKLEREVDRKTFKNYKELNDVKHELKNAVKRTELRLEQRMDYEAESTLEKLKEIKMSVFQIQDSLDRLVEDEEKKEDID